ncbi:MULTISPECIES: hypothetical protein [unclassified Paenibacillus]|uniref:hypothetical protein n=1 Tax=unclassified Paenibacillus TaxID=185978 RepID=UPI00020D7D57|nr:MULTISPECIES: hypothetical protein [unclassified Paenibacillus]EGL18436.1 hypothetical protein HMPREF9413_0222 [Paenibacillus sp. HGF7]EPD89561.1 hypothetical protein HMPREF1207_01603 [Paenibacillus sp. HGH0039]
MRKKYGLPTVVLFFLAGLIGLLLNPYQASALDYALIPLRQLEEESDVIVTGTVLREQKSGMDNAYTLQLDQILKGDTNVRTPIKVNVLQFSDEGKMFPGERYLLLLKAGSPFIVSGVHQGLIRLSGVKPFSRFYTPDEITALLDKLGAKYKESSSAEPASPPPENASPSPDSVTDGVRPTERAAPGPWEERKPAEPYLLSEWYGPLFLAAGLATGTITAFAAEKRARKQQTERDSHAPD